MKRRKDVKYVRIEEGEELSNGYQTGRIQYGLMRLQIKTIGLL